MLLGVSQSQACRHYLPSDLSYMGLGSASHVHGSGSRRVAQTVRSVSTVIVAHQMRSRAARRRRCLCFAVVPRSEQRPNQNCARPQLRPLGGCLWMLHSPVRLQDLRRWRSLTLHTPLRLQDLSRCRSLRRGQLLVQQVRFCMAAGSAGHVLGFGSLRAVSMGCIARTATAVAQMSSSSVGASDRFSRPTFNIKVFQRPPRFSSRSAHGLNPQAVGHCGSCQRLDTRPCAAVWRCQFAASMLVGIVSVFSFRSRQQASQPDGNQLSAQ